MSKMSDGMHNLPPRSGTRPKHLNLVQIRLPLPGVLSILHRVSGVVLIVALPFLLWALQDSVGDAAGYARVVALLGDDGNWFCKLAVLGAGWALFHHLCAGVRFLLLDFHLGVSLAAARMSAGVAFGVSILMTLIFGVWLW